MRSPFYLFSCYYTAVSNTIPMGALLDRLAANECLYYMLQICAAALMIFLRMLVIQSTMVRKNGMN